MDVRLAQLPLGLLFIICPRNAGFGGDVNPVQENGIHSNPMNSSLSGQKGIGVSETVPMLNRRFADFHGLLIGGSDTVYSRKNHKNQPLDCCKGGAEHDYSSMLFHVFAVYIKLERMKNIQVIDGADNSVYDIFQATDEEFSLIFPDGQDVAFIDEVWDRGRAEDLGRAFKQIWTRRIPKKDAMGIHGLLFYQLDSKRKYYPTRRDEEAINPDGSLLR
jgi:hypothetical protein